MDKRVGRCYKNYEKQNANSGSGALCIQWKFSHILQRLLDSHKAWHWQSKDFLQPYCGLCVQLWETVSQNDVRLEGNQRRD